MNGRTAAHFFTRCVSHVSHKFIRNGMKFLIMGYLCSLMGKVLKIWETRVTWQFPAVLTGNRTGNIGVTDRRHKVPPWSRRNIRSYTYIINEINSRRSNA